MATTFSVSELRIPLGIFVFLAASFVMCRLMFSIRSSPTVGWSRGFQSAPLFQLLMWTLSIPLVLPFLFFYFRRIRKLRLSEFVGNIRSRKFHKKDCEYQRKISSNFFRYPFLSVKDAERQGYSPCDWCCPRRKR